MNENNVTSFKQEMEEKKDGEARIARARLARYAKWHTEMLASGHTESSKYVIWKAPPKLGLGNKMQSLMSGFLFALASERIFLVDWTMAFGVHNEDEGAVYTGQLRDLFQNPDFAWDWEDHKARLNVTDGFKNRVRVFVPRIAPQLLCLNYSSHVTAQFLVVVDWDYWAPVVTQNPFYAKEIRQYLGPEYHHHVSSFLFRPVEPVMRAVDAFEEKYFRGKFVIALQIRHAVQTTWNKVDIQNRTRHSFVDCAYRLQFLSDIPKSNVAYFLATGDLASRTTIQNMLHPLVFQNITLHEQHRAGPRDTVEGLRQALIDLYLLARAHELIISHGSTFGTLPSSLSGARPYAVDFYTQTCTQRLTAEPCYAGWKAEWAAACVRPEDRHLVSHNMGISCFPLPVVGPPEQAQEQLPQQGQQQQPRHPSEARLPPLRPEVCPKPVRWGHVADGGWTVCGNYLPRSDLGRDHCIVFSVGINNDWSFDDAAENYGCRVYGFDPTVEVEATYNSQHKTFFKIGFGDQDATYAIGKAPPDIWGHVNTHHAWRMTTLTSMMAQLNVKYLQIFKFDAEGAEWPVLTQYIKNGKILFDQLVVEVHMLEKNYARDQAILASLTSMGYVMWSKLQNNLVPFCWELSFVYLRK